MRVDIFNDGISYVTDEVSSIPTQCANLSKETREKFVTDLAAVSRGKSGSNNPSVRFKSLLKEAAPNQFFTYEENIDITPCASRPLEFLPIVVEFFRDSDGLHPYWCLNNIKLVDTTFTDMSLFNNILRFSYVVDSEDDYVKVYTNFRTLYNAGVQEENIPFAETLVYPIMKKDNEEVIATKEMFIPVVDVFGIRDGNKLKFDIKELLNNEYTVEDIIEDVKAECCYVEDYINFEAMKMNLPMFSWSQWPMTHTQLSKESQSDRVAENVNYWLPNDIIEKFNKYIIDTDDELSAEACEQIESIQVITKSPDLKVKSKLQAIKDVMLHVLPQNRFQEILKAIGYKREIWSRAPYYFKYKEVVVTGWKNDPTTWQHSFLERNGYEQYHKNWTQKESQQIIKAVMEVYNG